MEIYPKTIYTDIVNMPDPMMLGITIHYYNHADENLYMKIFIEGPSPWTPNALNLGLLNSGANAYVNLDNFTSRTKPTSAITEVLTLTLKGYSDSGYTNLLYTFSRSLTIVFIKSDDGSWTTDVVNNFDDGTVQGWAAVAEQNNDNGFPTIAVATDYVLSTPYSCKMTQKYTKYYTLNDLVAQVRSRLYKSFSTPNKTQVFAIINIRISGTFNAGTYEVYQKNLKIQKDSDVLVFLGRNYDTVLNDYVPKNKWIRIVVPLPANTTIQLKIVQEVLFKSYYTGSQALYAWLWLDDFKIISK